MSVGISAGSRPLTLEQIRGLAPDYATLRAADDMTCDGGWIALTDDHRLWAEFPESRVTTRATLHLPHLRVACTCSAARFPCRHVVALLLRDAAEKAVPGSAPEWAETMLRDGSADTPPGDSPVEQKRLAALSAGMADLGLWLADLARGGLATLPKRDRRLFHDAADRLANAYAPEVARELREMAAIPGSAADWPERLLPRLGRLALLVEAYRHFDSLSAEERGDALAAAGHPPRPGNDRARDEWLVLGRRTEGESRKSRTRTWLRGVSSGRWALLTDSHAAGRLEGPCYPPGATFSGELTYYPGARPLAARAYEPPALAAPASVPAAAVGDDIENGLAAYAAALAANPWLRLYPLALRDVFVEPPGPALNRWLLRDRRGRVLPLPPRFSHGWRLLALAADRPLSLFGEWDGATFTPLSVLQAGAWTPMNAWRGVA